MFSKYDGTQDIGGHTDVYSVMTTPYGPSAVTRSRLEGGFAGRTDSSADNKQVDYSWPEYKDWCSARAEHSTLHTVPVWKQVQGAVEAR